MRILTNRTRVNLQHGRGLRNEGVVLFRSPERGHPANSAGVEESVLALIR